MNVLGGEGSRFQAVADGTTLRYFERLLRPEDRVTASCLAVRSAADAYVDPNKGHYPITFPHPWGDYSTQREAIGTTGGAGEVVLGSSTVGASPDTVFDVLSNPRRRYVLYYLRESGPSIELTDLAVVIAAWENDPVPENLTEKERKRVYVSLYQLHVPNLEEVGFVEYDSDTGVVSLTDRAHVVDEYLTDDSRVNTWQIVSLLVSLAAGAALLLAIFDVEPFSAVAPAVLGAAIVVAFVLVSIAQLIASRRRTSKIPPELDR
jgi:hypothetical protein